jgi:hypothetical protein
MKIKDIALSAAYVGQSVVKAICVGAQEVWSAVKYIVFKDKVVEQICATNFGDGNGLTEEDAAKVTSIGTVFTGNTDIETFEELENFTSVKALGVWGDYSKGTFKGCTSLKRVTLPPSVISLLFDTFYNCSSLTSVGSMENVTRVEERVFVGCPLEDDLYMPNLELWKSSSLGSSRMKKVLNVGKITSFSIVFSGQAYLEEVNVPSTASSIIAEAFYNCKNLRTINISHVREIGFNAFSQTPALKIPIHIEELETIGIYCFNTSGITEITSLGRVTRIPQWCFRLCRSLTKAVLPSTLTSMGSGVFNEDSALKEVIIYAVTPPALDGSIFDNTPSTMSIYVPDQSVQAYREASVWSAYADRIKPLSQYVEPTNE